MSFYLFFVILSFVCFFFVLKETIQRTKNFGDEEYTSHFFLLVVCFIPIMNVIFSAYFILTCIYQFLIEKLKNKYGN